MARSGDGREVPAVIACEHIGQGDTGPAEIQDFNAEIARLRTRDGSLDAGEVDGILNHALLGRRRMFSKSFSLPPYLLTGLICHGSLMHFNLTHNVGRKAVVQKIATIAAKLRMIQVLLLAAKGDPASLPASLDALDRELLLLADASYANVLRISTLSKLMFQPGVIDILPGVMGRLAALLHDPLAIKYAENMPEMAGQPSSIDFMVRAIFAAQLASVRRISTISRLLDEISSLDEADRAFFLRPSVHHAGDKAIAVKAPGVPVSSMAFRGPRTWRANISH